jgi:hypothetical protein
MISPLPTNIETYRRTDELLNVFRAAVREAQADSRNRGVANVYYFDGVRYFEHPDGEITRTATRNGAEQTDAAERE